MFANIFADSAQHSLHVPIQFFGSTNEVEHSIDKLAINIQLRLVARRVAYAHWPRVAVSLQMRQNTFGRRRFAENVIDYAQFWPG